MVVRAKWLARQSEVALAARLLFDRLPLATSHLSGDDRRANSFPTLLWGRAAASGAAAIENDTDAGLFSCAVTSPVASRGPDPRPREAPKPAQ
jgi:hypothetical protein